MSQYSEFRSLLSTELKVKREGLWRPTYELKDGQYSYGMLRHEGVWRPKALIKTSHQNWVVSGNGWKSSDIQGANGESVATTSDNFWGTKVIFTANDGFVARFVKPSIWKSITFWEAADGTELLSIKARAFDTPVISISAQVKENRWLLLLAFLALDIHLKRQRRAVAAAT